MSSVLPQGQWRSVAALLVVAFAFGGGGSGAGFANLVVQLAALAVAAFHPRAFGEFFRFAPRSVALLVGLSLALPLLQSVPLPPSVWQGLPGRDLALQSMELIDRDDSWLPFSVEAQRTLIAFFSLVPAATVAVLAWRMSEAQQRHLMLLVLAAALFMVLLGAQQMALGNRHLVPFAEAVGSPDLQGTFANRNSAGLFLVIALCLLVGVFPSERPNLKWGAVGIATALVIIIGLVLTRSRSSMALTVIPLAFAILRLLQLRMASRASSRFIILVLLGLALAGVVGGMLVAQSQRVQKSMARFDSVLEDRRPKIWADTVPAIKRYWPLGSGIGTFDEVFQVDETLENLAPTRAARAHNDYLETALESGAVGIALVVGWAIFLVVAGAGVLRAGGVPQAAVAVLLVVALQSISDYPLRNQTLLCFAGLMLAVLVGALRRRQVENCGTGSVAYRG